ncbi:MAG: glycosyltransferase family 2 protein [Nitrospirae bacterium]|nr:glycosyltransferase family 2 protein [Nitrospirota bacterium]
MTISVIIATKYRHVDVLNTLKSIEIQTFLPTEIIIIDQNTSEELKDAVFSLLNGKGTNTVLEYIHDPGITGLTHARNVGIERNRSDIVLFLDDDVILENDFIFNMMQIFMKNPDIYGVSGIISNSSMSWLERLFNKVFWVGNFTDMRQIISSDLRYRNFEYVPVSVLYGGLTSYRKEVFEGFKFDENFIDYGLSEDFDFSFRVSRKYKVVISPKAILEHVASDIGRKDNKKLIESIILSLNYFFRKNLEKNLFNYLSFIWLNAGLVLNALLIAGYKQDFTMLRGCWHGIKKLLLQGESDFIKTSA